MQVWVMAIARAATGGEVLVVRMASSAAWFQRTITDCWGGACAGNATAETKTQARIAMPELAILRSVGLNAIT
jgi:hypothetical protein